MVLQAWQLAMRLAVLAGQAVELALRLEVLLAQAAEMIQCYIS